MAQQYLPLKAHSGQTFVSAYSASIGVNGCGSDQALQASQQQIRRNLDALQPLELSRNRSQARIPAQPYCMQIISDARSMPSVSSFSSN
jgi:hypothetical protein